MVSVVCENGFYYLKHMNGKRQKRKYLGKQIPKNIAELKKQFLREFYCIQWDDEINNIMCNYKKETSNFESKSFGIVFTFNTMRIEGSTLTESDTKDLLIHGLTPSKKSSSDTVETQRHYDLFTRLTISKKLSRISKTELLKWHNDMFGQTKIGDAGHFRSHRAGITTNEKIEFATVLEIPKKMNAFVAWLNKCDIKNPVEFAALAHYKFVSIHPFADGNGRMSRLIMNYILFLYDCPFMLIKNIDRGRYFKSLERSQLSDDVMYFLKWFMRYYIRSNRKYLKLK